ncbi:hypothetical protein B0H11DRAFT_1247700 [Mycena galericulata]|nr:hypothetical protein B0H11DRAFT_1247700 [Mycena galericulata]
MQSKNPSDVEALTMAALILALHQAVHSQVLASKVSPSLRKWESAIHSFLKDHDEHIQEWVHNISLHIEGIVGEMKHKDIVSRLNIGRAWRFSDKEAEIFAKKLEQCIEAHVI